MKKLGFISLFLCCCMVINLSMAMAAEAETASDAVFPAAVEEAQPDADAELPETEEAALPAEVETEPDAELPATVEDEELDAELFSVNISYPIEGGTLYFDAINGIIESCALEEATTSVEIPAAIYGVLITKIGKQAFSGCAQLVSVRLPDSITEIGDSTFASLTKLTDIQLSNNLAKIGNGAFSKCTGLENVTLPDNITTWGTGVFSGCVRLNNVVIPARLTSIPDNTFYGCKSLSSITIATNVTSIGKNAFMGCDALAEVFYKGTLQQWLGIKIGDGNNRLIDHINQDTTFEVKSPKAPPVIIKSVDIYDVNGKTLREIPTGQFLASVSITGLEPLENAVVFFAAYSMDGQYEGLMYAFVQTSAGATAKVTFPFDNPNGNISQLRAFAAKSISDLTPLSNPVSFPA